jgi:Rha family phage regulatory protein
MNTLPIMQTLTMTSREIAELTGKEHKNVLRDIENMIIDLQEDSENSNLSSGIKSSSYKVEGQQREYPQYELDFDNTMCLVSGYSTKLRMRIIKRWRELEAQVIAQAAKIAAATTWEQQRQAGKEVRANFTNTLKNHGVSGFGFAQCTNGIYQPLFGATASKLRKKRGLTKQDSLRDAMNNEELVASTFAEIVASQHMDANKDHGNSPCYKTCKRSGQAVSDLLVKKLH